MSAPDELTQIYRELANSIDDLRRVVDSMTATIGELIDEINDMEAES